LDDLTNNGTLFDLPKPKIPVPKTILAFGSYFQPPPAYELALPSLLTPLTALPFTSLA
jgi:hypothetical protein